MATRKRRWSLRKNKKSGRKKVAMLQESCAYTTGLEWQADSAEPALLSLTLNRIQLDIFC